MDKWPYLLRLFYRVRDRYNKDMANQELIEDILRRMTLHHLSDVL
jgi:hypothetical protein